MSTENQTTEAAKPKVTRNYGPKETVPVSVPDVLEMLKAGKTRKEIGAHYGFNQPQTAALFKHPKLKGKKTIKQAASAFQFVDEGGDDIPIYTPRQKKEKAEANGQAEASSGTTTTAVPQTPAAEIAAAQPEKGAWD